MAQNSNLNSVTTTPFQSIFLSTTRPITTSNSNNNEASSSSAYQPYYKPYTILFQHSTKLSQRIISSEPSSSTASNRETNKIYQNAGIETPNEMNVKNGTGNLFIVQAWNECVKRCDGNIVFVQTLSSSSSSTHRKKTREGDSFRHNGVLVDLYSDPMGWDDDDENENGDDNDNDNDNDNDSSQKSKPTIIKGHTNDLQSILNCIHNAASHIKKQKNENENQQQSQQPIPVIFDSITSLLIHHGVHKFSLLLLHLKQQPSIKTKDVGNEKKIEDEINKNTILSPIFLPTTMEFLPPSSNQVLEDFADATMSLYNGKLHIAKRSARNNGGMVYPGFSAGLRLMKDVQYFEFDRIKKELILLNSASTSGRGNSSSNDKTDGKEVHSSSNDGKSKNDGKLIQEKSQNMGVNEIRNYNTANQHEGSTTTNKKGPIMLQHESDAVKSGSKSTNDGGGETMKPKPRIYIEENDPEFDDMDEEDPDDDLDI